MSGLISPVSALADTGTTLYVSSGAGCSDAAGLGTAAVPFCSIQAAANVTNPGDTVLIAVGNYDGEVDITRSGTATAPITYQGVLSPTASTFVGGTDAQATAHAITVTGASHVDISGIFTQITQSDPVVISGSSDIDLSDVSLSGGYENPAGQLVSDSNDLHITGGSTAVSLERSSAFQSAGPLILVDGGSDGTIVSTNDLEESGAAAVSISGATNTAITSNTAIIGFCGTEVSVADSSAGTSIENNLFETGYFLDNGSDLPCNTAPAAEISVDASSAAATTVDYNDVHAQSGDTDYSWAGTPYATPAALSSPTGEGAHDIDTASTLNMADGSPAIDSANADAIGELSTDRTGMPRVDDPVVPNTGVGTATDYDRGDTEFQDPYTLKQPSLTLSASRIQIGGTITATTDTADTWGDPASFQVDFGDGTTASSSNGTIAHTYPTAGYYQITGSGVLNNRTYKTQSYEIDVIATQAMMTAQVTPLAVAVNAQMSVDFYPITGYSFNFGDGTPAVPSATGLASHNYAYPGSYTVTLTVSDTNGGSIQTTENLIIQDGSSFVCGHVMSPRPTGAGITLTPLPTIVTTCTMVNPPGSGSTGTNAAISAVAGTPADGSVAYGAFQTAFSQDSGWDSLPSGMFSAANGSNVAPGQSSGIQTPGLVALRLDLGIPLPIF